MAQITFEASQQLENSSFQQDPNRPGFFNLKKDNDEAIVRFMHDDVNSFEIVTVHNIQVNGKYRNVNCIRDPREPLENCPFCAAGYPVRQRIYIHMIQYVVENGQIVPKPVIWERSLQYAKTLKSYMDNYGPLSDVICKIIRHGAERDMSTTYEIVPNLSKMVYTDAQYPKVNDFFKDYSVVGSVVMNKTKEELAAYVQTGQFPAPQRQSESQPIPPAQPMSAPVQGYAPAPQQIPQQMPTWTPPQSTIPNFGEGVPSNAPQRPIRFY